jgi:hypothetical protein
VRIIGHPYGAGKFLIRGIVSNPSDDTETFYNTSSRMGNSGSPVILKRAGKLYLIGINSGSLNDPRTGIPADISKGEDINKALPLMYRTSKSCDTPPKRL